jgi:hypothetical protein
MLVRFCVLTSDNVQLSKLRSLTIRPFVVSVCCAGATGRGLTDFNLGGLDMRKHLAQGHERWIFLTDA